VTPALSPGVALCRMCIHRDVTGALNLFVVPTVAPQHDRESNDNK
jgi:hypothetical protein